MHAGNGTELRAEVGDYGNVVDTGGGPATRLRIQTRLIGRLPTAAGARALRGQGVACVIAIAHERRDRLCQQQRPDGIGAQAVFQEVLPQLPEAFARMQHAGVVDQQGDAFLFAQHQRQFAHQFRARFLAAHVQRQHVQAPWVFAPQCVQCGGPAGLAAGGDDAIAARQQLMDEFPADAAVGAGDEGGAGHVMRSRWLPA